MTINPAYTGTRDVPSVFGQYSAQWIGLDGAPKTANFSIERPVTKNDQDLGLFIINDQIGPSTETTLPLNYFYPIQLSAAVKFSLGISASVDF